ncbi:MAG: hypothetical protein ACP5VQ_06875 [Phycisphaerae bacterium]
MMVEYDLAALSQTWTAGLVGGAVAVLLIIWFALRYWISTTHEPKIKDIHTPTVDRLNAEALEHMDLDPEVQAALSDNEPAPDDLLNSVSTEAKKTAKADGKTPETLG